MWDGTSPEYFAIGVVLIIIFLVYNMNKEKKHIDEGEGDELSGTGDYFGNVQTHKEEYFGIKFTLGVFLLALLWYILAN
jgi:hypothetical protein|tara:strand:- start:113 stop:349 length:237 start_codon:yes stop_codon:yes gene_type:complete